MGDIDPRDFWFGPREPLKYILGLDLGQRQDYSALCLLERHGLGREAVFHCRHLQRFKLGTSYPTIVSDMRDLCLRPPLDRNKPSLAIDSTGAGIPVVEMFTLARPTLNACITPITIHGGNETVHNTHGGYNVPKRELVSVTQVMLQTDRLKTADELPEANLLITELQNFRAEISETGRDTFEARSGAHDDLVLAVAMALWLGLRPEWKFTPSIGF